MQDAVHFDGFPTDAVHSQKRNAGNYQLAGVWLAAWTSTLRKFCEGPYALVNCECNAARSFGIVTFFNVVANVREVSGSKLCPADAH